MMKLDVRKLNNSRNWSGELKFSLPVPSELVSLPNAEIVGEAEVEGSYEILEDDSVQITGKVRYLLQGACTRCLKQTEKWIEAQWCPVYVKENAKDEEYLYENGCIVLDESVLETISFSMPFTLLCSENCQGIEYHQDQTKE